MSLLFAFFLLCLASGHEYKQCTRATGEEICGTGLCSWFQASLTFLVAICLPKGPGNTSICYCSTDADCDNLNLQCRFVHNSIKFQAEISRNNTHCGHKDLLPMNVIDITSAIILGLISALAASSGTGGGFSPLHKFCDSHIQVVCLWPYLFPWSILLPEKPCLFPRFVPNFTLHVHKIHFRPLFLVEPLPIFFTICSKDTLEQTDRSLIMISSELWSLAYVFPAFLCSSWFRSCLEPSLESTLLNSSLLGSF